MKKYFYLLSILLFSFLSEPSNLIGIQNSVNSLIIVFIIAVLIFERNPKYLLSTYIFTIIVSPWLTDFFNLSIMGLNFTTLYTILLLIKYVLFFNKDFAPLRKFLIHKKIYFYLIILLIIFDIYSLLISHHITSYVPYLGNIIRLILIVLYTFSSVYRKGSDFYYDFVLFTSGIIGVSGNFILLSRHVSGFSDTSLMEIRSGISYDPNYILIFVCAVVLLFTINLLIEKNNHNKFPVILSSAIIAISLMSLLFSGSRTALFSLFAGLLTLFLIRRSINKYFYLIILLPILMIAIGFLPEIYLTRFSNVRGGFEEARLYPFTSSFQNFIDNPIFGNGKYYYQDNLLGIGPHNTFLQFACEGGIFYVLIFIFLLIYLYNNFRRTDNYTLRLFLMSLFILFIVASNGLSFTLGDFNFAIFIAISTYVLVLNYFHIKEPKEEYQS